MALTARSEKNLKGVHRALDLVVRRTETPYPVIITEGLRSGERQRELLAEGRSKTLNSRHLTGHAIDFAVMKDGKVTWDWPYYKECADAFKATAKRMGTDIEWGGDWASFKDGTHVQLSWKAYPLAKNPKTEGNSKTIAASVFGFPVAAYIPELFDAIQSMVGKLSFFDGPAIKYTQFALVVLIAAFVVNERVQKMKREGS